MDYQIIQVSDFSPYRDISANIDAARINPFILEAQVHDLRGFLGAELYFAFLAGLESSPQVARMAELLNGKDYTPSGGAYNVRFYGLKPALIYFAYARFVLNQAYNVTRAGVKFKNYAESERVSESQINALAADAKAKANNFLENSRLFLTEFNTVYPEFSCYISTKRAGVRFFSVNKNDTF